MKKKRIKHSLEERIFDGTVTVVLIICGLVALYPLLFVVSASISDPVAVNSGQVILLPKGIQFDGYSDVLENPWVLVGYRNTLLYTVFGTLLNVVVTFMGGYALSRKDMYGHGVLTFFIVFTMWFGGGLIPTFIVVNKLGLFNKPYTLVILGMVSVYNLIICRSFIQSSIPAELQESARLDGCSDFGILWKIIFPLSGPVLAILCLYYALGHWNSYFSALIYLRDRNLQTLQVFLREILVQNKSIMDESLDIEEIVAKTLMAQTMKYSLIIIASVPMLIIYPFVQRFFVKGVMIGSVKG